MAPSRSAAAPPAVLAGKWILPLMGLWIAFSCSRAFGLSGFGGLPDITLERLCFGLLLMYAAGAYLLGKRPFGKPMPVEAGLWVMVVACLLSAFMHGGLQGGKTADTVNTVCFWLMFPAIAFMLAMRTRPTSRDLMYMSAILTVFAVYLTITAILEKSPFTWAVFPPSILDPSVGIHWGRSRGPFLNAAIDGVVMAQLLPIVLLLHELGSRTWRFIAMTTVGLICVGVFLTDTRACLLSLVAVTFAGALLPSPSQRTYRTLLGVLVVGGLIRFIIGAVLVPRMEEADPVNARMNLFLATVEMIWAHPILGTGFGTFLDLSREYFFAARLFGGFDYQSGWNDVGSHNMFLTPLAELGVIIGGLYFILVVRAVVIGIRPVAVGRTQEERATVHSLLLASMLVGLPFIIGGFLNDLRGGLTPNALFWTFAAFTERHFHLQKAAAAIQPGPAGRQVMARRLATVRR
jgi:O-antigen ligase